MVKSQFLCNILNLITCPTPTQATQTPNNRLHLGTPTLHARQKSTTNPSHSWKTWGGGGGVGLPESRGILMR